MLTARPSSAALADAVWIDLLDPTDDERRSVEQATRLRLPTRAAIEEIESSSRVYSEGDVFYLSTPMLESADGASGAVTPLAFVLSPARLVTVRFARVASLDAVAAGDAGANAHGARDIFLKLIEACVDQTADALERASAELEALSHAAFRADQPARRQRAKASAALHATLGRLGRIGDGISHVRDTLLGLGRIAGFVHESCGDHPPAAAEATRLKALRADLVSLTDYQSHLTNKVQFVLDATLGFINIEQNEIVKTLTIVSVVGVPPVLIAGIYGMNFKNMPELSWSFGYPLALALIVASGLLPIAWFKWRGWT